MRKKIYSKYWARERLWMSRESNLPVREVFSRDFRNRRAPHTPDSCMNLVVYLCLRLLVFVFTFGQKRQSVTRSRVLQDIHNKYEWVRTALALNLLLSRTRIAQIVFYRNSRFSAALYCLLIILISIDCDSDAANPFLFASNKSHQYFFATVRMNGTLSFSFSLFIFSCLQTNVSKFDATLHHTQELHSMENMTVSVTGAFDSVLWTSLSYFSSAVWQNEIHT